MVVTAEAIIPGVAQGCVLRSTRPLSFWGGVDPTTGAITDPDNEHRGTCIAGRILMLATTRGSSSSSSVLLELIVAGQAPAAIILGQIDAILGIGIVVAQELGYAAPPLLRLGIDKQEHFASGTMAAVTEDGTIICM